MLDRSSLTFERLERSPPPSFPPRSDKPSGSDEISGAFLQARTVGRRELMSNRSESVEEAELMRMADA
jgi:hypothetical protein